MAISLRGNAIFSRLKALLTIQRFNHTLAESGVQAELVLDQEKIDISKWRKLDSRTLGITRSMISLPSWIVLKLLQEAGFEAYLVGGCVRDLLLNRVPKDYDVITTAELNQIKKKFRRSVIVGRRFPICLVHVKGSVIEVSSFETVAKPAKEKKDFHFSDLPPGCDIKDYVRWRNCMQRDFTVNGLFFDPFVHKIYDYANGIMDLRSLKLQTLIPAQLSFEEDCARILRALRIAARLGLSLSKETQIAIRNLSSSVTCLAKSRLMMELNYMLSYGASEPSLCLLRRFNLLDILLPFQAAYLCQQACEPTSQSSVMLLSLFCNLDKLVSCDQPSDCILWVGLLAFHVALVKKPQDALVVWTFASVLYHEAWKEGVKFARENAQGPPKFIPEISNIHNYKSDDELGERVTQFARLVQRYIAALTEKDGLLQTMSKFPHFMHPGLVFVPKKTGTDAANLFSVLVHDVKSYREGRSFSIDYGLLGKGDVPETRFVLGKIIMDTMSCGIVQESNLSQNGKTKKQEAVVNEESKKMGKQKQDTQHQEAVKKKNSSPNMKTPKQQDMGHLPQDRFKQQGKVAENKKHRTHQEKGITDNNGKNKQDTTEEERKIPALSSLFR